MKWIGQQVYDFVATFSSGIIIDNINITTIQSSSESFADNDTSLMTSAAIDDRINTVITAEDLDLTADSGTAAVDLNSQALAVTGGTGITTSATGQAVAINVDAAQSGITSLGTLTGLVIDGNKSVTPGDGAMLHVDASVVTDSNTSASGTAAQYNHVSFEGPNLAAENISVTTTDAATLRVGRPLTGDNQTITNAWSLYATGATHTLGLTNSSDYSQTAGDMSLYDATNDGNPTFSIGSSATERLEILAQYESGAQGLDVVKFITHTAGSAANDARYAFQVDETFIFNIKDDGIQIKASGDLEIGSGNTILSDSSGTTTLSNIDAIDATTESTIETAIDTLSNLTTVGTIGTGVWQGTAIASAYLDADTAHLSGTQTFSGTKTFSNTISGSIDGNAATVTSASGSSDANHALLFTSSSAGATTVLQDAGILYNPSTNVLTASGGFLGNITGNVTGNCSGTAANVTGVVASANLDADTAHISATKQLTHHGISDDIDSDVVYISLLESDAENTSAGNKHLPIIAPAAGKLLKIFVRTTVDQSSETFTWKLYTRNTSSSTNGAAAEIGAQSGAGPTNKTMVTYDFTTGLDSGTNVIAAGDKVQISLQAGDGATANGGYFITCLWEWDLS